MAKRRRRRRAATNAPRRRRRRRNPGALARARSVRTNPTRRRHSRRRRHTLGNPRRHRRVKRNPSLGSARGIVGGIVQGLKDGGAVVLGQVGARKVRGAVTGMLPANVQAQVSGGVGAIALSLASAVVVSLVARKALPGQARLISAGAFSETINAALAKTPIAPFLSAYPPRRIALAPAGRGRPGVAAWPGQPAIPVRAGVAAYPMMRSVGMPINAGGN